MNSSENLVWLPQRRMRGWMDAQRTIESGEELDLSGFQMLFAVLISELFAELFVVLAFAGCQDISGLKTYSSELAV